MARTQRLFVGDLQRRRDKKRLRVTLWLNHLVGCRTSHFFLKLPAVERKSSNQFRNHLVGRYRCSVVTVQRRAKGAFVFFFVGLTKRGRFSGGTSSRWWFQIFFIFTPTWGNDPI